MPTRRDVLQAGTAVAVGATGLAALSAPAVAFRDARPDYVTLSYDQTRVDRFVPRVNDPPRKNADERPQDWYAWIATCPEYEHEVIVYVLKYRTQRGTTRWDSHRRDREPVYVLVDEDLDEVQETIYTGYHWYAAHEDAPPTVVDGNGEHCTFQIAAPWNHYLLLEDPDESALEEFSVKPLGTENGEPFSASGDPQTTFEAWLDTNWRQAAEPGVFQDPARMQHRDKWWRDSRETFGARAWRSAQLSMARVGLSNPRLVGGAAESDLA